jgi:Transposase.
MVYQVADPSNQDQTDREGILLPDLKSHSDTINTKHYCQMLQKLYTKLKNKHQAKLIDGTILLHDNTCSHVAHTVQDQLNAMQKEVLNILHTPQTHHLSIFTSWDR